MSRSALWRQEANVKERQRQADETFQRVLEEGKVSLLVVLHCKSIIKQSFSLRENFLFPLFPHKATLSKIASQTYQ